PSLDDPNAWVPYRYHPSRTAAVIFLIAFSLTTILHTWQMVRRRTWFFTPLVVGGLFEIVGFIGRILSTNDLWALGPYIIQSLLLLVAPALFAASIYIILGRIILLTNGEQFSLIRHKWLTKLFVAGDVISFVTQCGGGGIQAAGSLSMLHTGEKIIIVGLFLQLLFFGFFIVVAGLFHYRLVRANARGRTYGVNVRELPWKRHMLALYLGSGLIMFRSIFRVVEYVQGNNGYLLRHELYLYVFDALLMFVVMATFNWIHPAEVTDLYRKRISGTEASYPLQE
ncbi:RTA1 like protein, partial [Plenodomus tracheiphilus IPT5]